MKKQKLNPILEKTRKKGRRGDTILAHINPLEAHLLKKMGGSGTINPKTGLPEYGIRNFGKWLKGSLGGGAGAILGNMLLPGLGGIIGGALGGVAGSAVRGRRDYGNAGLRGAAMGAIAPSLASGAGYVTGNQALSAYGANNAILPAIGRATGLGATGANVAASGTAAGAGNILSATSPTPQLSANNQMTASAADENYLLSRLNQSAGENKVPPSYLDKLGEKSLNLLSDPLGLLTVGTLGANLYDKVNAPKQPKPLTAKQRGKETKEEMLASMLSPEELAEKERYELALEQARRRNARKKFLPEERINIDPLYNRVSSPEEFKQSGRWINYYNNPQFTGQPIKF